MFQRVLILAPHTDDGELGCGGTIAKLTRRKETQVWMVAFSNAWRSLAGKWKGNPDILVQEFHAACGELGVPASNREVYDFEAREFPAWRQEILQRIIDLKRRISPDVVFVPSPNDIHQDHQVIAQEGLRAFKKQTILGYEEPWNNIVFETRLFVKLNRPHVDRKIRALKCYETQLERDYLNEEFILGLARTRGTQIESKYAEAFEVLRMVLP